MYMVLHHLCHQAETLNPEKAWKCWSETPERLYEACFFSFSVWIKQTGRDVPKNELQRCCRADSEMEAPHTHSNKVVCVCLFQMDPGYRVGKFLSLLKEEGA